MFLIAAAETALVTTGPEAFFGHMGVTFALIFASIISSNSSYFVAFYIFIYKKKNNNTLFFVYYIYTLLFILFLV